jgi:hypothetical protein
MENTTGNITALATSQQAATAVVSLVLAVVALVLAALFGGERVVRAARGLLAARSAA